MADYLYRRGRLTFGRRRLVLVGWVLALGITLGSSIMWSGAPTNGLDVPGTEAQQAINTLQREFPQADAGARRHRSYWLQMTERPWLTRPSPRS